MKKEPQFLFQTLGTPVDAREQEAVVGGGGDDAVPSCPPPEAGYVLSSSTRNCFNNRCNISCTYDKSGSSSDPTAPGGGTAVNLDRYTRNVSYLGTDTITF